MSQNWVTIKSSDQVYQLEILKGLLLQHDITSVVINKQDSSYMNFGEAELKILESDSEKALQIINQENE
ncbi:MAG: DUF2007 domain-containing protein [Flavobacteriales bacterium]|tara:strand:+ start:57 stop:263 length:207 start_codon:yes stop_codon:yes gene_type:complete